MNNLWVFQKFVAKLYAFLSTSRQKYFILHPHTNEIMVWDSDNYTLTFLGEHALAQEHEFFKNGSIEENFKFGVMRVLYVKILNPI